jgi:hypothetical protein
MYDVVPKETPSVERRETAELDVSAVATAFSLLWGCGMFLLAWWVRLFSRDREAPLGLGRVYPGYRATAVGSVIGAIWGFIDGFLAGWFYAWLYNTARRVLMNRPTNQQATPEGGE